VPRHLEAGVRRCFDIVDAALQKRAVREDQFGKIIVEALLDRYTTQNLTVTGNERLQQSPNVN
jgi:hypothetical protein